MTLLLASLGILLAAGILALLSSGSGARARAASTAVGAGGCVVGCAVGIVPAIRIALGGKVETLRLPWQVPMGSFSVACDALSAIFLVAIFFLGAVAAIYGAEYLLARKTPRRLGPPWFFYGTLLSSMVLVVIAGNAVLFLVAWEVMTLASFFLVVLDDALPGVREAGWTYLVATHLGTAFLLVFFLLLGRESGSLDFDRFGTASPHIASTLLVLAVIGFGTKAGFMPFHVWLPEAHPAAPSHVSALMSGVMIKTGIYGILRALTFLGTPPPWWGWLLVAVGLTSGVGGVLFALAQHELKRLLAYHSVENIGIIALGMGISLLGQSYGSRALAVLGLAGALLHVLNHALFKGLLFLCAGSVLHGTGEGGIDRLGGLLRRMPWTAATFLVGAVAISGLPPLNGFVSEFLVYLGSFRELAAGGGNGTAIPAIAAIVGLALIGGLATACFTKAFGVVFLGHPRSPAAANAHEAGLLMRASMLALAGACLAVAFGAPAATPVLGAAVRAATGLGDDAVGPLLSSASEVLVAVQVAAAALVALTALVGLTRYALLRRREVVRTVTWDCGYAEPTARMQYTGSSFAQPLVDLFGSLLRPRRHASPPDGLFPRRASLETHTPDLFRETLWAPAFEGIRRALWSLRWLQHGRVQIYVLYIALTLLVLLLWKVQ